MGFSRKGGADDSLKGNVAGALISNSRRFVFERTKRFIRERKKGRVHGCKRNYHSRFSAGRTEDSCLIQLSLMRLRTGRRKRLEEGGNQGEKLTWLNKKKVMGHKKPPRDLQSWN